MVRTLAVDRLQGNFGPSAEKSSNSDRGGKFNLASRKPSNDGASLNATRGRHESDDRPLKTGGKCSELEHGMHEHLTK